MFEAELEQRLNDIQFNLNRIKDYQKMLSDGLISEKDFKEMTAFLFESLANNSFNAFNFIIGV